MAYDSGMNLGAPELIVVLLIVMLLFGASRLPKLARSLGESAKELRDGLKEGAAADEAAKPAAPAPKRDDQSA